MAPDQMGMSAPAISPDQFAVFDQMRQQLSPKEFSDEVLAGASQIDPAAVAEFTKELQSTEITPQELEELNNVVDEILANPEQYEQIRERYISQGLEEDLLPEKFDPFFFAALNMAVDQMIAAPAGPRAFAKGGIAELKPIAKALASYGRNGDTMLAHITPAEARMLRRRGGAGTINPNTGLPEFFRKAFRKIKKAIKKFASSTVGKIVTTVALGFFLGPAAASALGATSAAGVAAVSGFVGSAGSTLAAGGNLRDALKAGAIGGLTAGAGAVAAGGAGALQAGSYTGPTTVGGQWDKLKGMLTPGQAAGAPAAAPGAGPAPVPGGAEAAAPGQASLPGPAPSAAATGPMGPGPAAPQLGAEFRPFETTASKVMNIGSDIAQGTKNLYNQYLSPSGIQQQAIPGAQTAGENAINSLMARVPDATPAMKEAAYQAAFKSAMPGVASTYGPAIAAGLGVTALAGGFKTNEPELSPTARELLDRDKNRPKIEDRPDLFYIQGLPGVKYDEKGRIIGSTPWQPSATMEDIRVPAAGMSGIGSLNPPMYTPQAGAIGAGQSISQPYNTSSMYNNIMRPTPMPQIPFPGLGATQPGAPGIEGIIKTLPFQPGGYIPTFAEGGEAEELEYLMHGGMPHGGQQMAGLASLAQGGYPRRTGQISGPGTEKSDSIPAMLSDGEFVMTAKAVRGAGNGSRRAGAKKMYALMHQLERNASRG